MLEQFTKLLDYCTYCPRLCQSACPVAMTDANEAHTPWGLMQTMNLLRKSDIPFDQEVAALSFYCLSCRACTAACEHLSVIPPVLHEVRKEAIKRDLIPTEISEFLTRFHKYNNPFARDLLQKLKTVVPKKYFENKTPVVFFPSCTAIARCPEIIQDTFELFEKLKINFVSIYPEIIQCCGYPLISAGMEEEFFDIAEINFHALKNYKTIISDCPSCVYTLKETYNKYDFNLKARVMTVNQFLEPYLHNINFKIKKNIRTKLMYHDPCFLARHLGESDLPRELIAQVSGCQPLDFYRHGTQTSCCGHGGCFAIFSPEISNKITKKRLEEVTEKNCQTLVTQCPSCIHKFRKNSERLVVKDLVSYLNDCIEGVQE